jgi:hypothetical protein
MAQDPGVTFPKSDELSPPPRSVPFLLWCHLLANPVTLAGSGLFAFGMLFTIAFLPAADLVTTWRLSQRRQEAPGWLEAVQATNLHEGGDDADPGTPIYRCEYSFRLPDETVVHGRSYTLGPQYQLPPAAGGPSPRLLVTVEYDPEHPTTNRIRGTRTSPFGTGGLFVLLFPAVGLLIAVGALAFGRGRARLLRDGEAAAARVTACRFASGDDDRDEPVAACKQRLAEGRAGFGHHPAALLGSAFLLLWTVMAAAFVVLGTIVCLVLLGLVVFVFDGPVRECYLVGMGVAGFLVLWLAVGSFMVRSGWRALRASSGCAAGPVAFQPVTCVFEFPGPEGELVQGRSPGRLTDLPGDEPPQAALYDPSRPKRARLLSGLWPAVRVGPTGGWETGVGPEAFFRLLVALVLLAGPPLAWALFP